MERLTAMNSERTLIAAIAVLGFGLGLLFGYTHGTASFSAAYPVSGASLQVAINTSGWPAMAGVGATVAGVILLFAALVLAVLAEIASGRGSAKHQGTPAS
jgi:hypothetical protein